MKVNFFERKAGKIFFAICCVVLAFVFWFVVTYNQLGSSPTGS